MVLYKYTSGESGIKVLQDLRLKVTPPNEFNDPFELTPRSKFTITLNDMLNRVRNCPEYYRGVFEDMKKDGHSQTFEQFIETLPKVLPTKFSEFRNLMRKKLVEMDMQAINEASQKLGILCVSKKANDIQMWSHYANHHKGIAIGLDLSKAGGALKGQFGEVKYRKPRRGVDPWLMPPNPEWFRQVTETIFTKGQEWIHESEYRRVFRLADLTHTMPDPKGNRHYLLDIGGDAVREIILGCRIEKPEESLITNELQRRPKTFGHVKLFRCKRHDTKYELEILPI
jgi:hypothetical protein